MLQLCRDSADICGSSAKINLWALRVRNPKLRVRVGRKKKFMIFVQNTFLTQKLWNTTDLSNHRLPPHFTGCRAMCSRMDCDSFKSALQLFRLYNAECGGKWSQMSVWEIDTRFTWRVWKSGATWKNRRISRNTRFCNPAQIAYGASLLQVWRFKAALLVWMKRILMKFHISSPLVQHGLLLPENLHFMCSSVYVSWHHVHFSMSGHPYCSR